jgi:hypothetical protein
VQYGTLKPADHPLGKGSERLVDWHTTYQQSRDFRSIHAQMISDPLTNIHSGIQYSKLLKNGSPRQTERKDLSSKRTADALRVA